MLQTQRTVFQFDSSQWPFPTQVIMASRAADGHLKIGGCGRIHIFMFRILTSESAVPAKSVVNF